MNYNQQNFKEFITASGYALLQEKREKLVNQDLPRIVEALAAAREHHDYRENGELDAARSEKELLSYEIGRLNKYLNEVIICSPSSTEAVDFGLKVKVVCTANDKEVHEYILAGSREFSIERGSIYYRAPFAQQMMHKAPGQTFQIKNDSGTKTYKIVSVTKPSEDEVLESLSD